MTWENMNSITYEELLDCASAAYHGEFDERHSLECKTKLNWSSKRDCLNIARSVLGLANRTQVGSGCAVLLIGIDVGVTENDREQVDPTKVRQALDRYLGSDGPRWLIQNIEVMECWVQALVVDSPQWGDPIYTLQRDGETENEVGDAEAQAARNRESRKYDRGTIFVRDGDRTARATPEHVASLTRRAIRGDRYLRDIAVEVTGHGHRLAGGIEEIIQQEGDRLLRYLESPRVLGGGLGGPAVKEHRTPEAYATEVQQYLEALHDQADLLVAWWLYRQAPLTLRVVNLSDQFRRGVALTLRLPNDVVVVDDPKRAAAEPKPRLGRSPRPYGERPMSLGMPFSDLAMKPYQSFNVEALTYKPWLPNVADNSTSVEVQFHDFDLRAGASVDLAPVTLITSNFSELVGEWTATAHCAGRVQGEVTIEIEQHTIEDVAERVLGHKNP